MTARIFSFNPAGAEEASRVFSACTRLAGEGRDIRAVVLESPDAKSSRAPETSSSLDAFESLGSGEAARVILSHSGMNRIREISREDYLAVVDGGVRFGDFSAAVRDAGLFFPHEANEATRGTTIAGLVMAGAKFPTEERFGRLREYILSLELVTPKGEIVRAGSRSVKDVTGYDLIGFAVGAGSRCGMIARATLRLLPAPFGGAPGPAGKEGGARARDAAPTASGARRFDDRTARPAALRSLEERIYEVFDPAGIMKPPASGVE